jgi:hypothetical protein
MAFLNCRPSVIAAALLYVERRSRGIIPFWPSMLAKLTGYQDMSTPELSVAIKAAQRMCGRVGGIPRPGSASRSLSRPASSQGLASAASSASAASAPAALGPPISAGLQVSAPSPTPLGSLPTSGAMGSADLAAAVAAAAAAAAASPAGTHALGVPPVVLPPALPRVQSSEHTLSALRQAGRLPRSSGATPPPTQHLLQPQLNGANALIAGGVPFASQP